MDEQSPPVHAADHPPVPPMPEHKAWRITRTNRKATCRGCGEVIEAYTCRAEYLPKPEDVHNPKVWSSAWNQYFHIRTECISKYPELPIGIEATTA
jgi:hypothetical protein